jgi:hypothetical protein
MNTISQILDTPKLNQLIASGSGSANPKIESESIIVDGWNNDVIEITKIWYPWHETIPQSKQKLWGLFKGLEIDEEAISEAKKSLFPDRF